MAIDMITGEWFSLGKLVDAMPEEEREKFLNDGIAALTGAIDKMERGEDPDIESVNMQITGADMINKKIASVDPDNDGAASS
jgi:hypothetical protein